MKLQTLKFALTFGSAFVWFFLILVDVCMLSRQKCLLGYQGILASLEGLPFGEPLEFYDDQQNLDDLPRGLNHHTWEKNCIKTTELLCNFPIFPKAPDKRRIINRTLLIQLKDTETDAHRLFGFILPTSKGEYRFAVASNGFAEIWLSPSKNWRAAKKVAFIQPLYARPTMAGPQFNVSATQISSEIHLKANVRYYIEILYTLGTQDKLEKFLIVAWKRPKQSKFEVINREFLSLFINDGAKDKYKMFDDDLPDAKSCATRSIHDYTNKHMKPETLPYLEHSDVSRALHFCAYQPSYLVDPKMFIGRNFTRYSGVKRHVRKTNTYPFSIVDGIERFKRAHVQFHAEQPLDEEEAWSVVLRYMDALEMNYDSKYKLESIRRIEKKTDPNKGGRYLLNLVVTDRKLGKRYLLSEYVFQPNGVNVPLCYPMGLQWNRTADVYLILTAKNLGRWVHHFIKNVERIVEETRDENLHLIIYDFDSPDIDLEQALQRSRLKNYHFITKPGKYSRTTSFTEAIDSVKDPNAIIVTTDLHLDIGSQVIDDIRKHCSLGKTVYAPQIVSLACGGSSSIPKGYWYHYSYGTIAMYKQDWHNFGGFSQAFSNKSTWGGEDWDIIDNAVRSGLEIERKRSQFVYHYRHSKVGMW